MRLTADTEGVAIPVTPPEDSAEVATVEPNLEAESPATAAPGETSPLAPSGSELETAPVLTQEPPAQVASGVEATTPVPVEPVAVVPPEPTVFSDSEQLAVPALPTATATVPPLPEAEPVILAATGETVLFGQPLPSAGDKARQAEPAAVPNQPPLAPDVLIAAGTVLQMRYPGSEPLALDPNGNLNEVLVLESEIRDPITNGVLAPAGSQLIGQFEPSGTNQRWVSQMLIVAHRWRVPFASTSEYLVGSPQIDGGSLAIGTGVGALALTLLTGFSGIGLIGGAIMGLLRQSAPPPSTL
ncbi:MAG: hypothetical protein HC922_06135 [Leptolyngbyaceae cyanobacterium SM2_3_12]|nr:hypothetical protein [Leptolyngbyaceae cyanobacterium SM2_3_12]